MVNAPFVLEWATQLERQTVTRASPAAGAPMVTGVVDVVCSCVNRFHSRVGISFASIQHSVVCCHMEGSKELDEKRR